MNGYELLAQLKKDVKECFTVPNKWLPEEFQDNRSDQRFTCRRRAKCDATRQNVHYQALKRRQ